MGEHTKALIKEASSASGLMSGYGQAGKKWRELVDPKDRRKIDIVNKWRGRDYNEGLQEIRDAHLSGDIEKEKRARDKLERNSKRTLERLMN